MPEESLVPKDVKSVAKAVYRHRRKGHGRLPRSIQETHGILEDMEVKSNKSELLLQTNDNVNGLIIFSCLSNIQCLCSVSEIFMDGTYKCCPKFFSQLYTIHGFKNGHCIPLVYALLSGKSESTYRHCISAVTSFYSKHGCKFKPSIIHV